MSVSFEDHIKPEEYRCSGLTGNALESEMNTLHRIPTYSSNRLVIILKASIQRLMNTFGVIIFE